MSGENIWHKFMNHYDKKERKDIESKLPEMRDSQIYREFPNDLVTDHTAIKTLQDKTGLDEHTIVTSVNRLIEKQKIISVNGRKTNKLYLRKNPYS
jgi:predicted DNA-binding ArsR family transcriptional regulator